MIRPKVAQIFRTVPPTEQVDESIGSIYDHLMTASRSRMWRRDYPWSRRRWRALYGGYGRILTAFRRGVRPINPGWGLRDSWVRYYPTHVNLLVNAKLRLIGIILRAHVAGGGCRCISGRRFTGWQKFISQRFIRRYERSPFGNWFLRINVIIK